MDADTMTDEFVRMESVLTIFELLLLLRVAADIEVEMGPFDPIWSLVGTEPRTPIEAAPFLSEKTLRELALQQRLVSMGMLTLHPGEDSGIRLTPKGHEAVNWFVGTLEDLGFRHEVLAAD